MRAEPRDQPTFLDLIFRGSSAAAASARAQQAHGAMTVQDAANIFKTLGHDGRLAILYHLAHGEKSVNEIEALLDARQSAVSQQLARLRMEGMVNARREGQAIYYSIKDQRIVDLLSAFGTVYSYQPSPMP